MMKAEDKICFLEEYREHPEKYLPMADNAWKQYAKVDRGDERYDDPYYNLGWDAALLEGNRPYFMLCWATCGITMLTYYVSTSGIGEYGEKEMLAMLENEGLLEVPNPAQARVQIMKFEDDSGNEFFSVNIKAGDEEGTYVNGGNMFPLRSLNSYNRVRKGVGCK